MQAGKPGKIIIKVNAITEKQLMQALYRASMAGVQVDLIVRSICCLRPGIPGVSENIRVRSVVGRFLEHTRVFYFENSGDPRVYCASADWMDRNLFSRVEVCFPIDDPALRKRIIRDGLQNYLLDNQSAWHLQADGRWERQGMGPSETPHLAQNILLEKLAKL